MDSCTRCSQATRLGYINTVDSYSFSPSSHRRLERPFPSLSFFYVSCWRWCHTVFTLRFDSDLIHLKTDRTRSRHSLSLVYHPHNHDAPSTRLCVFLSTRSESFTTHLCVLNQMLSLASMACASSASSRLFSYSQATSLRSCMTLKQSTRSSQRGGQSLRVAKLPMLRWKW